MKATRSYRLRIGSCSRRLRPVSRRSRSRIAAGTWVISNRPGFAAVDRAAHLVECLQEERPHEERLKAPGFGPFHLLFHLEEPIRRHRFLRQSAAVEQRLQVIVVERVVDLLRQLGAHLGAVAVADGLHEQLLEAHAFEHIAEDIEDATLQGVALDLQLLQQSVVNVAFAGLLGDEVPEVADLGLADAVNTAEALFEAVGVPGQVVVDHEVGALKVHAFAGGVGGDQHADVGVGAKQGLRLAALVAVRAAVDGDDGLVRSQHAGDLCLQVVQRVAVLGEDNDLPLPAEGVVHLGVVLQQLREFFPLPILARGDQRLLPAARATGECGFRLRARRWSWRPSPDRRAFLRAFPARRRSARRRPRGRRRVFRPVNGLAATAELLRTQPFGQAFLASPE